MANQVVTIIDNEGNNIYPVAGALMQESVTTSTINNGAVTADKIDFTTLGGNYSTTEQDTGFTWINGEHIYKKTIDLGGLPNATTKSIAHGITNLGRIIKQESWAYSSTDSTFLFIPHTNTGYIDRQVVVVVVGSNIDIRAGSDQSPYTEAYTTLYYTKTA